MQTTNQLGCNILEMLLAGDLPVLATLRNQLEHTTVRSRNFSGAGFFTHFSVPQEMPTLSTNVNFEIGGLSAEIGGVLCGFILFVRGGAVDFLEGFVYGNEPWPSTPVPERIGYLRHPETGNPRLVECAERDYAALEANLGGRRSDVLEQ